MNNDGNPADDDTSTTKDEGCEQQDTSTMQSTSMTKGHPDDKR
jgi:hypothetical protein